MKYIKSLLLLASMLLYCSIAQNQEQTSFLNNPASGITTYDSKTWNKVIPNSPPYQKASTGFYYIYLSDVLRDNCFTKKGELDKEQLALNIKNYFDKLLDYTQNKRYNIRIFPEYNGTQPCTNSSVIKSNKTDDGKQLINYPKALYYVLSKQKFPPKVIKAIFPEKFTQTKNIALMDMRNTLVQSIYDAALQAFATYLEEDVTAPRLQSGTNAATSCKKGDFIARIEMGFVGPWGEGMTKYQNKTVDAQSLTNIAECYKRHLYKYWLIAPAFGMRSYTTPNEALYPFELYLLTTKYGTLNKKNSLLTGNKEFGLFIDHIGSRDSNNDFLLTYKGKDFKTIALEKWKVAPVIGENSGRLAEENDRVMADIERFGLSLCNVWTSAHLNTIADSSIPKWRNAAGYIGYRFYLVPNKSKLDNGKLHLSFLMGNRSYAPLYDDFWLPQIVVRDSAGKELKTINIDDCLRLKEIPCLKSTINYELIINAYKQIGNISRGSKIYFRIIDKCHINENMFLDNEGRTEKGEYLLVDYYVRTSKRS